MKTHVNTLVWRTMILAWIVVLLAPLTSANAKTFVINFGGSLGDAYSPSTLKVSVGDTVSWQGSFSFHPLSSLSVPVGAQSFHQATGSVLLYPVTVAGTYTYKCDFHVSLGMEGSFTTDVTAGVENQAASLLPNDFSLGQNYPNPFNPATEIKFALPTNSHVLLTVYDVNGRVVSTIADADYSAGFHTVNWNASNAATGVYLCRITAGNFSATRKMMLVR
ncbi:MAG: T9SS C-terminal target domain-containing protein [Ignavibacteriae bacterium]|nr:MAG: T9SS C-terminal target domain-containing protein [Ignavibacteriota bacterium]